MRGTDTDNRLAELRETAGLSQTGLGVLCNVTEQTVARWERGKTRIPDDQKRFLCAYFGVTVEQLLGWDRCDSSKEASAA